MEEVEESNGKADHDNNYTEESQSACGCTDKISQDTGEDGEQASASAEISGENYGEDGEGDVEESAQAKKKATSRQCRDEKRKKPLFTIQAVNSNGTTDRGIGDGNSTLTFSSESGCYTLKTLVLAVRGCLYLLLINKY